MPIQQLCSEYALSDLMGHRWLIYLTNKRHLHSRPQGKVNSSKPVNDCCCLLEY
jgi:hypothetical protein